jgi:hypothetical protein
LSLDLDVAAAVRAAIKEVADPVIAGGGDVDAVRAAVLDQLGIGLGHGGRGVTRGTSGMTIYAGGGGGGGWPSGAGSSGAGGSAGITAGPGALGGGGAVEASCPYCGAEGAGGARRLVPQRGRVGT